MSRLALPVLVLALAAPARAADIAAAPVLTDVTVYPDRARVVRAAVVTLPAGESTVVFAGLPPATVASSVRVEGEGDTPLAITSVETRSEFLTAVPGEAERALTDRLQAARDERQAVDDRIAALKDQLAFIESVARSAPPEVKERLVTGEPGRWAEAWTTVGEGAASTYAAMRAEQIARREVAARVKKLEEELSRIRTGRTRTVTVRVHLAAERAGEARLRLDTQILGASWQPVYDARLDPETARLTLVQMAEVRQKTGEDWNGVTLTLATARPAEGAAMPEPEPWFLDFPRPFPGAPAARMKSEMGYQGFVGGGPELKDQALEEAAEPVTAVAEVGEFTAEFHVPGAQAVPADNEPHRFTVTSHAADATLRVRAYPKADPAPYLYAELPYDGEAPLLAGPVNLFRAGALVGRYALPAVRPGETLKLPFGADDRVRIDHRLEKDLTGGRGVFNRKRRAERRYRVEVENFHRAPVEVTVYDRLPVPKDKEIRVARLEDGTPPTGTDVEHKAGVLAWTRTYAPGGKGEIRFGYTVTWPEGRDLPGF
jgi:uncharacterized protein (TIGR02231 family)